MSVKEGSGSIKQETCFSKAAISFQLGAQEGTEVPFSSMSSQVRAEPVEALPHSGQTSFPVEGPEAGALLGLTMSAGGIGIVEASEIGSTWESSARDLLAGDGATALDLKKRLCYLSLNSACRFATMFYSFPSG